MFSSFAALLDHLDGLGLFHVDLGLGRMRAALAARAPGPLPFYAAQVLGTNGKGSTATFLAELAQAHGIRTGLYTSPHFLSPTERILLDGRPASEADWLAAANCLADLPLTYFEFLTMLAVLLFRRRGVRFAVFEAGLGGKNDATTALGIPLQVYAPIDVDHAAVIGPELADIARDKAGAIGAGSIVCSSAQNAVAAAALEGEARAKRARLLYCAPANQPLGMPGAHQRENAGLALLAFRQAARALNMAPDEAAIASALARARIPGRLQLLPGPLLLDGAHNPHALRQVLPEAKNILGDDIAVVFSALADKNWREMTEILKQNFPAARFFIPQLDNPRAAGAGELAAALGGRATATVEEALRLAGAPALATGSLYLLAEIYALRGGAIYGTWNPVT